MFTSDGHLNPEYNSFKNTGLIPKIFEDNWDDFYSSNKELVAHYRANADFEISKIIDCMNKDLGCSVYQCPDCGSPTIYFYKNYKSSPPMYTYLNISIKKENSKNPL